MCWHKSNCCFELRLLLPFTFLRRIEILLLCCKPSETLCGRLLWAAQIQSCTRQAEFLCNACSLYPCLPPPRQNIFVPDMGSRENHLQPVLCLLWQANILSGFFPLVSEDLNIFHFSFKFLDLSETTSGEGSKSNHSTGSTLLFQACR